MNTPMDIYPCGYYLPPDINPEQLLKELHYYKNYETIRVLKKYFWYIVSSIYNISVTFWDRETSELVLKWTFRELKTWLFYQRIWWHDIQT